MSKMITFILLNLFISSSWAVNYFDESETCLLRADLQRIEKKFHQFGNLSKINEPLICAGKEISKPWFMVARSLLILESLKEAPAVKRDEKDQFTVSPIIEKNWWEYLTKRASKFAFHSDYCDKNPQVMAFVRYNKPKIINLCNKFFEESFTSQVSILMHEVRHFDGYSHVTCSRGSEKGIKGACDKRITEGGSYAVSIQANVGLAKSGKISQEEKALLESMSIYYMDNKFNAKSTIKVNEMIYLSHANKKVYKANVNDLSKLLYVTELKSPAKIYSNISVMTLFPLNKVEPAYRYNANFKQNMKELGGFANKYNFENEKERELYIDFNYSDNGFFMKGSQLYYFCGAPELQKDNYNNLNAKAFLTFHDGKELKSYIQAGSGNLYAFSCDLVKNKALLIPTEYCLPMSIVGSVGTQKGENFILTEKGQFFKINIKTRELMNTKLPESNWISVTSRSEYVIFEN